jgi:hypothetical protein
MTPIDKFLDWFNKQDIKTRDVIAFQLLCLAPDFDLFEQDVMIDDIEIFRQYLSKEKIAEKVVGKLLFVKYAIDYIVIDYDREDIWVETQKSVQNTILKGESEGHDMDYIKETPSEVAKRFEFRKNFKEDWTAFCSKHLSFETLDRYMDDDLLKNPE